MHLLGFLTSCFPGEVLFWTPLGYRAVRDIQPGDLVFARDEHDPFGPIVAKEVEAKFERTGQILHLHLAGGKLLRTTPEHPFFRAKPWLDDCGGVATGGRDPHRQRLGSC